MPDVKKTAIVPYSAQQMYDLVNQVEHYPEFLPHCSASKILSQDEDHMRAELTLAWGGMEKSFTTLNRLQKNKMIEVRLEKGPFHHLEGFWRFESLDESASKVLMDLEFEVAGSLFSRLFEPVFHQVANTLVDSFVKRAKDLYGDGS